MLIATAAATATAVLIFSFTDNLSSVNEKYKTPYPNVPSWVFEIEGNDALTAEYLQSKYRNMVRAPMSPNNLNNFSLVEARPGRITDYNEVSPILVELFQNLKYNDYPHLNPPTTNTENFKPGEVRKWVIRRI